MLSVSVSHEDQTVVRSHAEVFRGEYVQRMLTLEVKLDPAGLEPGRTYEASILADTNPPQAEKPRIEIPVTIEVESPVRVTPGRVFFGLVHGEVERQVTLSCESGPWRIVKITSSHPAITATAGALCGGDRGTQPDRLTAELQAGELQTIAVHLKPGTATGTIKGSLTIQVQRKGKPFRSGNQVTLDVPFFALVHPASRPATRQPRR